MSEYSERRAKDAAIDDAIGGRSARRDLGEVARGRRNEDAWQGVTMNQDVVMRGVTANWLAQVLNQNVTSVKQKLKDCPPIHRRKEGYVYDFKQAIGYLVKPVFNLDDYVKNMRIEDMPVRLQSEYWNAKNKRRAYELEAGELWRTEQVFDVFAEAFQAVKQATQLWSAEMERERALNEDQREFLGEKIRHLQEDMYKKLVEIATKPTTKSVLQEELEEEAAEDAFKQAIQQNHEVAEYVPDFSSVI